MRKFLKFIKDMLSEDGIASSKRVFGGLIIVACLVVLIFSVVKEGMTGNNKDIVDMLIGSACLLLGITSVTNIWKKGDKNGNE